MLCSHVALTPKAHTLTQEGENFYVRVEDILDEAGNMDIGAFRTYVHNLAFDWGVALDHSHPCPSLDGMARVMSGRRKEGNSVFILVFVFG